MDGLYIAVLCHTVDQTGLTKSFQPDNNNAYVKCDLMEMYLHSLY